MTKEEINLAEEFKKDLMEKITDCNSLHKNCDFLLEHSDCDMLTEVFEENKRLKETIKNKDHWLELIYDIGYDYDGWSDVEHLMGLINELVGYTVLGLKNVAPEEWRKKQEERIRKEHKTN